jgi:hypothetical protein
VLSLVKKSPTPFKSFYTTSLIGERVPYSIRSSRSAACKMPRHRPRKVDGIENAESACQTGSPGLFFRLRLSSHLLEMHRVEGVDDSTRPEVVFKM